MLSRRKPNREARFQIEILRVKFVTILRCSESGILLTANENSAIRPTKNGTVELPCAA